MGQRNKTHLAFLPLGSKPRKGIKFPTLMYYKESEKQFIPMPSDRDAFLIADEDLKENEYIDIKIKCIHITDEDLLKIIGESKKSKCLCW